MNRLAFGVVSAYSVLAAMYIISVQSQYPQNVIIAQALFIAAGGVVMDYFLTRLPKKPRNAQPGGAGVPQTAPPTSQSEGKGLYSASDIDPTFKQPVASQSSVVKSSYAPVEEKPVPQDPSVVLINEAFERAKRRAFDKLAETIANIEISVKIPQESSAATETSEQPDEETVIAHPVVNNPYPEG